MAVYVCSCSVQAEGDRSARQICNKLKILREPENRLFSLPTQHVKLGRPCVAALYRIATISEQFPDTHHIDQRCTTRKEAYNSPESLICAPHHIFLQHD